ncbi:MAG: hypothetical protein M0Z43_04450 [Acidithiobacillus sp.]|nr:hypothetical protein [Acidithiobacillus sp.]
MKTTELFAAASPETKAVVRSILELDIDMTDSMSSSSLTAGGHTRPGARTPGDPQVATIQRDFQRSLKNMQIEARGRYEWLTKKYAGKVATREEQRAGW